MLACIICLICLLVFCDKLNKLFLKTENLPFLTAQVQSQTFYVSCEVHSSGLFNELKPAEYVFGPNETVTASCSDYYQYDIY